MVACESGPSKPERCSSIFSLGIGPLNVLLLVDFWRHMVLQPGVHNKVATCLLFEQANDGVRVGHLGGVSKANSNPLVSCLCLDHKLNGVALLEVLPLGKVTAVALLDWQWSDIERRVDGRLQVGRHVGRRWRPEATIGRMRPATHTPLGLHNLLICRRRRADESY